MKRLLAWAFFTAGLAAPFAHAADSYSVLPEVFSPQLRSSAEATVQVPNHACPLSCYQDDPGTYLANARSTDVTNDPAQVYDPALYVNAASAQARMGFGWMKGSASGSVASTPPLGSAAVHSPANAYSNANFAFSDILTINAAGLAGRPGLAHARLTVTSSFGSTIGEPYIDTASNDGTSGAADLWFNKYDWLTHTGESGASDWVQGTTHDVLSIQSSFASNNTGYTTYRVMDPHGGPYDTADYNGAPLPKVTLDVVIPFTFGQVFGISAYGEVEGAEAVAPPSLSPSDPNYPFTRYATQGTSFEMSWGGIQSVELDGPDLLATGAARLQASTSVDYTLSSVSGADYRQAILAVPEPGTWVLLGAGLMLLGSLRRVAVRPADRVDLGQQFG